MKNVNETGIEFLTHAWSPAPGCLHGLGVCATADKCWARNISHRFKRDFRPHVNLAIINPRFPQKPGARIGVNFMGDLFGEWWFSEGLMLSPATLVRKHVIAHPEHQFFFLTKNPVRYAQFNPWPENAWLGASITGAEPHQRQSEMLGDLAKVQRGHRWVSYEPVLGHFMPLFGPVINWLVIGVQSGAGAFCPQEWWIGEAIRQASRDSVPVFLKNNLLKLFPGFPRRREMP